MKNLQNSILIAGLPFFSILASCSSEYDRGKGRGETRLPEAAAFNSVTTLNRYPEFSQKETLAPTAFEEEFPLGITRSTVYLEQEFSEFWMQLGSIKKAFPTNVNQCFYYINI